MKTAEIWKDIPGFNGEYQASNLGNIRRIKIVPLKPKSHTSGYAQISATNPTTGKLMYLYVHRVVLASFDGAFKSLQVNHKNFNKLDNRLENLEWVTRSQNSRHAVLGGRHNKVKLNKDKILEIRNNIKNGESLFLIAKRYGVHYTTINNIKKNKTWECV